MVWTRFCFRGFGCVVATILTMLALALGCSDRASTPQNAEPAIVKSDLGSQSELFKKGVEKVTDGVYVGIGYGLANSILIEGDDGVIIVDTLEGRSQAEEAKAAFETVTKKPVKAVILTHNHADHVFGGLVFTGERDDIPVFAHDSTTEQIDKVVSVIRDVLYVRSLRMFGQALPPETHVNCGIGLRLDYRPENVALARPTKTFSNKHEITIAGIDIVLLHAPGETPDQIAVWLPDKKVLIPADNIYQAFPNLYTIRGTGYRDVMQWVESLDMMRDLGAEYLVPCHTRPLSGASAIDETLTAYRDAIQFVHDQTVRNMNRGLGPEEIVDIVHLPEHLARHTWLQEQYGTVAWSVRGVYDGYLGWFNGDAAQLNPLSPSDRARRIAQAFEEGKSLADQARAAVNANEFQWGAELSRMWMLSEPELQEAKDTLAKCLDALGRAQVNANAFNYYLTQAGELRGDIKIKPPDPSAITDGFIDSLPIASMMRAMASRLDPEKSRETDTRVLFHFTDVNEDYTIHVRRGVAEVRKRSIGNPDMRITTTAKTWKRIVSKKANAPLAYASGDIQIDGGVTSVVSFLGLFDGS
jgi:alkyl sulfatase BDS1-like metallo-beta-lactamase superfamily hydrolase